MAQIQAYLHFNGNCREAMTFYKECLGGELSMQTVGDSPTAGQMPAEMHNSIMHAQLANDGFLLLASDLMGPQTANGSNVSLLLECKSEEEIRTLYANLAAGGQGGHALENTFWGAIFGDVTDKFGFNWMFNYTKGQNE
ncbi:MAG TPA: VOC family protein [Ktedonobacter sp.]|nr:VOC family protein [Ktedonobacter sp.]